MERKNCCRMKTIFRVCRSKAIEDKARGDNKKAYTRRRKMPVYDIIESIVTKRGLTTSMEIYNFIKRKEDSQTISVQGYLAQRKKLNPEVFIDLNDQYLKMFYDETDDVKTWRDFVVLAVDGSVAEIPNSDENRMRYGTMGNNYVSGCARAKVNGLFDVLNSFFLDLQICGVRTSETECAKRNLEAIGRIGITQKVIVVFGRAYPSIDMLNYLDEMGMFYIFRIFRAGSGCFCDERRRATGNDGWLEIRHTAHRLENIKERDIQRYGELKEKGRTGTRCIRSSTTCMEEVVLFTNLDDSIGGEEIADAYFKRWQIEEAYHTLKNKMKFESVTGKASVYVEQDFLSQVFVHNLMEDIRQGAEEELVERKRNLKYPVRVNQNVAIGIFKEELLRIMTCDDADKIDKMIENIMEEMQRYYLPVRDSPSGKRVFHISNKYALNQKSAF